MTAAYELFVRDAALGRVAQIDDFTRAIFVLRFNRPGSWRIEGIPASGDAAGYLVPGAGIVVRRDDEVLLSGPLEAPTRRWADDADHLHVEGPDDLIHLWDRIAHPDPAAGNFASAAYDVRTGACETVLKGYVTANAGSGALTPRRVAGLTVAADTALGTSVTGRARLQVLGDLLAELAVAGGDLGFRVVQSDSSIEFQVYDPEDLTGSVIFSPELGNLASYTYDERAPDANYVYVGGGGEGTARTFLEGGDSASISEWGRRRERFVDQRQTTDTTELGQKRDEELAVAAERTTLELAPIDTESIAFGTDYGLGDLVSAVLDGVVVEYVIREVRIELTADGAETVTPILGTPQAAVPQLSIFDRLRALGRRLTNVERR